MDLQELVMLLGNGFFPIVCCGVMFWLNNSLSKTLTELSITLSSINQRLDNIEDSLKLDKEK